LESGFDADGDDFPVEWPEELLFFIHERNQTVLSYDESL
jgi:hypothetical protein